MLFQSTEFQSDIWSSKIWKLSDWCKFYRWSTIKPHTVFACILVDLVSCILSPTQNNSTRQYSASIHIQIIHVATSSSQDQIKDEKRILYTKLSSVKLQLIVKVITAEHVYTQKLTFIQLHIQLWSGQNFLSEWIAYLK